MDATLANAIYAARADGGHGGGYFRLDSPATPERLRMACADQFTEGFLWCASLTQPLPRVPCVFIRGCAAGCAQRLQRLYLLGWLTRTRPKPLASPEFVPKGSW